MGEAFQTRPSEEVSYSMLRFMKEQTAVTIDEELPAISIYEAIFNQASDGYVVVDEELKVQYMNQTARNWFGDTLPGSITCGQLLSCQTEHGVTLQNEQCFGCTAMTRQSSLPETHMMVTTLDQTTIHVSVSYSYIPFGKNHRYLLMALRDITAQKRLEYERMMNEALRLTIEERERIARDLHDTVAQDMAYSSLQIKRLRKDVHHEAEKSQDDVCEALKVIGDSIDHSIDELRSSLYDLSFVLETDFVQFVKDIAMRLEVRSGITTNVVIQDTSGPWSDKIEEQLARIVKEVFTNITKHAKATQVTIQIERSKNAMDVVICDNGCGFTINEKSHTEHFGFRSIIERCKLLGGQATIDTAKGKGTTWRFHIPETKEMVS